jgi:hypothetical protein
MDQVILLLFLKHGDINGCAVLLRVIPGLLELKPFLKLQSFNFSIDNICNKVHIIDNDKRNR